MEDRVEAAARAAHEVNRVYCREVLDDNGHLAWKDTPEHIREGVIDGVRAIIENPSMTCADLHARWMSRKLGEGWTPGTVKDYVAKKHPALVSFAHLPLTERVKDTLFGVVVRAVLGIEHNVALDTRDE